MDADGGDGLFQAAASVEEVQEYPWPLPGASSIVLGDMLDRECSNRGRLRPRLASLYLAFALGACSTPQPPTLTPHVARVAAVSLLGIELDIEVKVDNPNSIPLAVESVSGILSLAGGQKLGHGTSTPAQSIPAEGSSMVQTRLHVDWDDLTALSPFLGAEHVPYTFRGDVTLGSESFNVTLPFTLSGHLTRSELLQAGLRGL
jgi:LEA14-like dessication related protein